jgi:hypothetical protein
MADLEGIQVGEYGKTIRVYCKYDGKVQNVGGYSTDEIKIKFWSPKPVKQFEVNGDYSSSGGLGADGIVEFAFTSAKTPDRAGIWDAQLWLESTSALIKSKKFSMLVGE